MATGNVRILSNEEIEWSVPDLEAPDLEAPEKEDFPCYRSPPFLIIGECWLLLLSLNNKVSVGLSRENLRPSPLPVKFSVSLKVANRQELANGQKTALFEEWQDYHYIDGLLSTEEYGRRKSELCNSGSVMIIFRIKILTADDLCNVVKEYGKTEFMLKITEMKNSDIKKELEACKADKESLLNELKSTRENFESLIEELNHLKKFTLKYVHSNLERCGKEMDDIVKELDVCKTDRVTRENWGNENASNASASSEVHQHDKILQDLKQALQKKENCDVVLKVKGREFPAHKVILAARSPVFASTFRNDMKEKTTGIVDIEDCDPSVFADFLCFLYCDDVDSLSEENVFSLFTAADKYDVKDLRKMCLEFMEENLSVETFCETLTLALLHSESDLIRLVTEFFIRNADKIVMTVKWQSFAADNPTQSNELIVKLLASDRFLKS